MNLRTILLVFLCATQTQIFAAAESWVRTKPSQRNTPALINRLVIFQLTYSPYADVADDTKYPVAKEFFSLTEQEIADYLHLHPSHARPYLAAYAEAKRLVADASPQATMIAEILRKHPDAFKQKLNSETAPRQRILS